MASPTLTKSVEVVMDVPFLVHRLTFTSGATSGTLAHGGPAAPIMAIPVQISTNPTGGDIAITDRGATTITVDCEDDGSDTWEIYCIYGQIASGGIS